jgi:hypothetical protein
MRQGQSLVMLLNDWQSSMQNQAHQPVFIRMVSSKTEKRGVNIMKPVISFIKPILVILAVGCTPLPYNKPFHKITYNNVDTIYGTDIKIKEYYELQKYNGIRVGADGYVNSLVQLPEIIPDELPHYTYTPPPSFRENYERERGWRK